MFCHTRHYHARVLVLFRLRRIEVCIRYCCPAHPSLACAVHKTRMDLCKRVPNMVVESGRDVHSCRPELDVTDRLGRVICVADVETD